MEEEESWGGARRDEKMVHFQQDSTDEVEIEEREGKRGGTRK